GRSVDFLSERICVADGHSEIDTEISEPVCQFRCATSGRMDHVQNTALRVARRQHVIRLCGVGKFRTYRKAKHLYFFRGDSSCPQNGCALLVCNNEIISVRPIPYCVDCD